MNDLDSRLRAWDPVRAQDVSEAASGADAALLLQHVLGQPVTGITQGRSARLRRTLAPRARLSRGQPRRRLMLQTVLPVFVVAASAAVLLATVAPAPAGGGLSVFAVPPGAAGAHVGTAAAARHILLTAALNAGRRPVAATGRYWEIPAVAGNVTLVGHGDDHYLILQKTTDDRFMARAPRAWSPEVVQPLDVQLTSPADRTAWLHAGSPATWHAVQEFGLGTPLGPSSGELSVVTARRGPLFVLQSSSGSQPFAVGGRRLSYRQLLALPASPALLKKLLMKAFPPGFVGNPASYLFQTAPTVLDMPVTPAVRSALYRMLASLPGVRSLGQVQDVAGQPGTAVSLSGRYTHCGTRMRRVSVNSVLGKMLANMGASRVVPSWLFSSCVVQQRLVINPATGLPIAQELRYQKLPAGQKWLAPGGLFSFEVYGAPKWTDTLPHAHLYGP
jgi:hypothetical protein